MVFEENTFNIVQKKKQQISFLFEKFEKLPPQCSHETFGSQRISGVNRDSVSICRRKIFSPKTLRHAGCILTFVRFAAKRYMEERIRKVGNERERDVAGTVERFFGRDVSQRPAVAESRGAEQSLETQVARGKGQNERGVSEIRFSVLPSVVEPGFFF